MIGKTALIILSVHLILVRGKLICKTHYKTDVTCEQGNTNYILKRGIVSDNNDTITITLKGCRIIKVELNSFENNYNLKQLDLSHNEISDLKLGILNRITKLTSLRLSHNSLTELPLGIFDQLPKLERLDLIENDINSFEPSIFDALTNLFVLDLSGNDFTGKDLNPFLFNRNTNIQIMSFSSIDMSETPDNIFNTFQALTILELNKCSLQEVPHFATTPNLKTLKILELQFNEISKINDPSIFTYLENLETLDVTGNMIYNLDVNVFRPLGKLVSLVLSYNNINEFPGKLFMNIPSLQNVDLSYNFIETVPISPLRKSVLRTLNLNANRISFLDTNFFMQLNNSSAKLTTLFFNDNPFQCACLLEILSEAKRFKINYNSDKYDGLHAVCFMTNEFTCMRHKSEYEYPLDFRQVKNQTRIDISK